MADLGASAVFGAINTAFRFSEFVIQLSEVGSENNVFVRTIQRVRLDLEETERLLTVSSIKILLASKPEKLAWIKNAIFSTKHALNDIGLYVERVRADNDRDGAITFGHRVRWVLKDHEKLENRRSELAACHQTLTTVLNTLHPLEVLSIYNTALPPPPTIQEGPPPAYESSFHDPDFKSPYQRKKRRPTEAIVPNGDLKKAHEFSPQVTLQQDFSFSSFYTPDSKPSVPAYSGFDRPVSRAQYGNMQNQITGEAPNPRTLEHSSNVACEPAPQRPPKETEHGTSFAQVQDYSRPVSAMSYRPPVPSKRLSEISYHNNPWENPWERWEEGQVEQEPVEAVTQQRSLTKTPCHSTNEHFPVFEVEGLHISEKKSAQTYPPMRSQPVQSHSTSIKLSAPIPTAPAFNTSASYVTSPEELARNSISSEGRSSPLAIQHHVGPQRWDTYPPPPPPPPHLLYPAGTYPSHKTPDYVIPHAEEMGSDQRALLPYPRDMGQEITLMPAENPYQPPRVVTAPVPTLPQMISPISTGGDERTSRQLHPESAGFGGSINRSGVSQSRRRRAMREAALGVLGEK